MSAALPLGIEPTVCADAKSFHSAPLSQRAAAVQAASQHGVAQLLWLGFHAAPVPGLDHRWMLFLCVSGKRRAPLAIDPDGELAAHMSAATIEAQRRASALGLHPTAAIKQKAGQ